jgi:hypothetical protein
MDKENDGRRVPILFRAGFREFALTLPLLLILVLGIIEVSYALYDQHLLIKYAREGSNLISRGTKIGDFNGAPGAATAMISMASPPVDFNSANSTMIFSVIQVGATSGTSNYGKPILYQRYKIGTLNKGSVLNTLGGSFGGPPDYYAINPDNDTNLRITNLAALNIDMTNNPIIFVTEVYSNHNLITPFNNFGFSFPSVLYANAIF